MSNLIVSELIYENDALTALKDRNTSMILNKRKETRRVTVALNCGSILLNSDSCAIFLTFSFIDFPAAEIKQKLLDEVILFVLTIANFVAVIIVQ